MINKVYKFNNLKSAPFFSICIPQYNRTSFLLRNLKSISEQSFNDFEVCISDGGSNDGREAEIIGYLKRKKINFIYKKQTRAYYDENIRASINIASGKFCLLMGNDDCLSGARALEYLHNKIKNIPDLGVVVPNFRDFSSGAINYRIQQDDLLEGKGETAARYFRNLSFVSGIILNRELAQEFSTNKWDGSEMYQMYLGTKIISSGYLLLNVKRPLVRKDIKVKGEVVDNYTRYTKLRAWPIAEISLPIHKIPSLVIDALAGDKLVKPSSKLEFMVLFQFVLFTCPFWIFEYRRVQSWLYAYGFALASKISLIAAKNNLRFKEKVFIHLIYFLVTFFSLTMPIKIFDMFRLRLYKIAKS